jgi:hypothetical protein
MHLPAFHGFALVFFIVMLKRYSMNIYGKTFIALVIICFTAIHPLVALELGVSVIAGTATWDGAWNESVVAFSEDFNQTTSLAFMPGAGLYFDSMFRPYGPLVLSLSLGVGSWGGRLLSEGGTAAPRVSSIGALGMDFSPSLGLRLPLGHGEVGFDARIGLGLLVSHLWTIEAWKDTTALASYSVAVENLGYLFSGASISYLFHLGAVDLSVLVSGDIGANSFMLAGDLALMHRFGVGTRISFPIKKNRITE